MNQHPDKFFRDKLEGFSKSVPSNAWEKIEANLDKKNNTGTWWKVAAAILIVALGSYVLWPSKDIIPAHADATNSNTDSVKFPKKDQPQLNMESKESIAVKDVTKNTQVKPNRTEKKTREENKFADPITDDADKITVAQHEVPPAEGALEEQIIAESENVIEQPVATAPDTKNIKLVFRADDTDEYLDKKALAKATDDEENASTFKKLLKRAKGLKNNQDPLGELRQKKNEILALNFKNEKRGQNK